MMTLRVTNWEILEDSLAFQYARGKIFLSVLLASVMFLHINMQEQDILEHTNGNCHLCTLQSTCRPLCNIGMHFITLLNILMPRYQKTHLNAKCHEVTHMMKLLIILRDLAYVSNQGPKCHYYACDTKYHERCGSTTVA